MGSCLRIISRLSRINRNARMFGTKKFSHFSLSLVSGRCFGYSVKRRRMDFTNVERK